MDKELNQVLAGIVMRAAFDEATEGIGPSKVWSVLEELGLKSDDLIKDQVANLIRERGWKLEITWPEGDDK